jgi:hypothetical protein
MLKLGRQRIGGFDLRLKVVYPGRNLVRVDVFEVTNLGGQNIHLRGHLICGDGDI